MTYTIYYKDGELNLVKTVRKYITYRVKCAAMRKPGATLRFTSDF